MEGKSFLKNPVKKRLPTNSGLRDAVYWVYDWLEVLFFVTPLGICYWRGTMEPMLAADDPFWFAVMAVAGSFVQLGFYLWRHKCGEVRGLYPFAVYLFGVGCVAQWSGVWGLLDLYLGPDLTPAVACAVGPSSLLACARLLRNITGAPFDLSPDSCEDTFDFPTAFKSSLTGHGAVETGLYVLDCFFSVFVIGSLVVFVWRGAWAILDVFLYPEDSSMSAISSLILGYGVVLVTFSLQAPMKRLCDWLTGFWRICAVDVYIIFSFVGTINLWRGIWMLLNIYFLPDDMALSCWITHIFSFLLLVLINCSNSVLVRGVYIDGEEQGGKCVDFPTYYLRMFFQEQRKKKLLKQSQRMRISTLANKADEFEKAEKMTPVHHDAGKGHVTVELPIVTRF